MLTVRVLLALPLSHWTVFLAPVCLQANKEGGAMFKAGAAKQVCKGARWSYGAELQALKRAMEEQVR